MIELKKQLVSVKKEKPADETKLGFGTVFTDHMLMIDYNKEQGWHDARIVPYGDISISPAAMCLHYGQTVFEGMKAYRDADGKIRLFRPDENFKRLNRSNDRLGIPPIDCDMCLETLKELLRVEKDWVPSAPETSLYIRPFIFATEPKLGVKTSDEYCYMVLLSPSGPYYSDGLDPVAIYVEDNYVRAVRGGTGEAKTGGNYAASLKAQEVAHDMGFSQVLWLDGIERKYIEEVGSMNVFFVLGDEVVTPALNGSILSGITRKSCLDLLRSWGMKVSERRISVDELEEAYKKGEFKEAFGAGTAAVISPIGELKYEGMDMKLNDGKIGPVSQRLYDTLTGIQWGRIEGPEGWSVIVE